MKHEFAILHELNGQQVLFQKIELWENSKYIIQMKFFHEEARAWVENSFGYDKSGGKEIFNEEFEKLKDIEHAKWVFYTVLSIGNK